MILYIFLLLVFFIYFDGVIETESSYGMGVEGESPILLPWQHNKSSCLHEASGFGTGSNESGASSDISSKY